MKHSTLALLLLLATGRLTGASPHGPVLSLPAQVQQAELAFLGRVQALREEPDLARGTCFTHVTFGVQELLFDRTDSLRGDAVTLTFAGGRVGEEIVTFCGVPRFEVGELVVVLTLFDGKRYASPIVGGDQGLYRLAFDERTGAAYPLLSGRRGIASLQKGAPRPTERLERIQAGVPRYADAAPAEGPERVPAPLPVAGSRVGQTATEYLPRRARPTRLVGLGEFLDSIRALHADHPASRR
jgi:hypothetical protein